VRDVGLRSDVADLVGRSGHLGMLNSRMNDFFDVWFVAGTFGTIQNMNRKPNRKYLGSMSRPSGFTLVIVEYPLRSFTVPAEVNCRFDTLDAGLLK